MPLSVCLLCHKINKNEDLEELDFNVGNNVPSYQICIGKGTDPNPDSDSTLRVRIGVRMSVIIHNFKL